MSVHYEGGGVTVLHGDCIEQMRTLPDASVHAVVTDPPYGLEFMGKAWDSFGRGEAASDAAAGMGKTGYTDGGVRLERPSFLGGLNPRCKACGRSQRGGSPCRCEVPDFTDERGPRLRAFQIWCEEWARECHRVLKPGGHLLAFGGSRTWHRLAAGIEDAGFEMRDSIAWLYGSGFPKSMDVGKAITGHESGHGPNSGAIRRATLGEDYTPSGVRGNRDGVTRRSDTGMAGRELALSENGAKWDGWGTALKPAFEPIVVARKPLAGTVATNVLAHGTGALNIAASRVAMSDSDREAARVPMRGASPAKITTPAGRGDEYFEPATAGRWPTNVLLDESQAAALDQQSGTLTSGTGAVKRSSASDAGGNRGAALGAESRPAGTPMLTYGDTGGASRYFPNFRYEAKAPTLERPSVDGVQHPTVKPLDLMRWLVRLVTPPGGTVLEPFAGSGTTVEACLREGFSCIAIEREADYLPLIMSRIRKDHEQSLFGDWEGESA